jgi:hypothetical protein
MKRGRLSAKHLELRNRKRYPGDDRSRCDPAAGSTVTNHAVRRLAIDLVPDGTTETTAFGHSPSYIQTVRQQLLGRITAPAQI